MNLTQYEIALYLTLIREGSLNARDLSDKSDVPYSRIYNILSMLLDKGYVQRDDTQRPSTYVANPPDEALMLAKKKVNDAFGQHSKVIVEELNEIYLKNIDAPFQLSLLVYRGEDAVFKKAASLLNSASQSILVASNDLDELQRNGIIDIIKDKRAKGVVDIKILIEDKEPNVELAKDLIKIGNVRRRDQIFGTGIAVDGVDAIIVVKAQIFSLTSFFGMRSDHEAFGSIALQYFNYLFNSAAEFEPSE